MNIFEPLVACNIENHAVGKCNHKTVTFNVLTFNFKCHKFEKFQTTYGNSVVMFACLI